MRNFVLKVVLVYHALRISPLRATETETTSGQRESPGNGGDSDTPYFTPYTSGRPPSANLLLKTSSDAEPSHGAPPMPYHYPPPPAHMYHLPPPHYPPAFHERMSYIPFLGYVDPLVIIAIIALPVLGTLGVTSLIMPLIPIAIYIINLFFPAGAAGKKRRRRDVFGPQDEDDTENSAEAEDGQRVKEWLRAKVGDALKTLHAALEQYDKAESVDHPHL